MSRVLENGWESGSEVVLTTVRGLMRRIVPRQARRKTLRLLARTPLGALLDPNDPTKQLPNAHKDIRLWVGPLSQPGQATALCAVARRNIKNVDAIAMAPPTPYRGANGTPAAQISGSRRWRAKLGRHLQEHFTHVVLDAANQPRHREPDQLLAAFIESELRTAYWHEDPRGKSDANAQLRTSIDHASRPATTKSGLVTHFVATPLQTGDLPNAIWCPPIMGANEYRSDWPLLARHRPVVLRVRETGAATPPNQVDTQLQSLEEDGIITYQVLENPTTEQRVQTCQEADIVIEPLHDGWYSQLGLEALAAGRIVLSYGDQALWQQLQDAVGVEVPIITTDTSSLSATVTRILQQPDAHRERANKGPEYVRAVHGGGPTARAIARFLSGEVRTDADAAADNTSGDTDAPWHALRPARPHPGDGTVRLFVGPVNFSKQAHLWAHSCEKHLSTVSGRSMGIRRDSILNFPSDYEIDPHPWNRDAAWCERQQRYLTQLYTHVLQEAGRPLTGRIANGAPTRTAEQDAQLLQDAGLAVGLIAHGSEIRIPSVHRTTTGWSPFTDDGWDQIPVLEENTRRNADFFNSFNGFTFVSTPDLLDYIPHATWCPVVIEPDHWACPNEILESDVPVVAHIPSSERLKGTQLIEPIMRECEAAGLIRYLRMTHVLPHELPALYAKADIVLDQFALGSYGVAACEAMAANRLVLGHVTSAVRQRVLQATNLQLPIIEATPDNLLQTLQDMRDNRDWARGVAARGKAFVSQVHDGRVSARVLQDFLQGQ